MDRDSDLDDPLFGAGDDVRLTAGMALDTEQLQARILRLEQELITAKRAKRAVDIELVELRSHLHEADLKLGAGVSGYYRLGRILVEAASSWRGLLNFVPRMYQLVRDEWRARPRATPKSNSLEFGPTPARDGSMIAQLHLRARTTGHEAAAAWVLGLTKAAPVLKSRLLMEIAKLSRHSDAEAAIELARKALTFDKIEAHSQWLAFALHDAGWIFEPARLVRELRKQKTSVIGVQAGLVERILAREELLSTKVETLPAIAGTAPRAPALQGKESVILFVEYILPLRWSLAACRFHIIALALQAQGRQVVVACPLRPGSAQPRVGHVYETDGVQYAVIDEKAERPQLRWLNGGEATSLENTLTDMNIQVVYASSRLSVMVQAMKLARRRGLHFVIDDEGDEPFAAAAGISSSSTEFVQLTRQLKQDLLIVANQVSSPWRLTPVPVDKNAAKVDLREHSILHGRWVMGFVGEQVPEYNLALLPTVFQYAADAIGARGKLALLMAGVGRGLDLAEDQLVEQGWDHDVLLLHRPTAMALASIYTSMDVFVAPVVEHPGTLDRAPIELILAIRFGVPVVASDSVAAQRWKAAGLPIIISERADGASLGSAVVRVLMNSHVMAEARRHIAAWNATHTAELLGDA